MAAFQTGGAGIQLSDLERWEGFYPDLPGLEVKLESPEEGRKSSFLGAGSPGLGTLLARRP